MHESIYFLWVALMDKPFVIYGHFNWKLNIFSGAIYRKNSSSFCQKLTMNQVLIDGLN